MRQVRVEGQIIVTTLLEPAQISPHELAELYAMRWNIEVDFRTLKAAMNMDVLRCKSPAMVKKEIAVYLRLITWCAGQWPAQRSWRRCRPGN